MHLTKLPGTDRQKKREGDERNFLHSMKTRPLHLIMDKIFQCPDAFSPSDERSGDSSFLSKGEVPDQHEKSVRGNRRRTMVSRQHKKSLLKLAEVLDV